MYWGSKTRTYKGVSVECTLKPRWVRSRIRIALPGGGWLPLRKAKRHETLNEAFVDSQKWIDKFLARKAQEGRKELEREKKEQKAEQKSQRAQLAKLIKELSKATGISREKLVKRISRDA